LSFSDRESRVVDHHLHFKTIPQGLKPNHSKDVSGTTEVVPFHNSAFDASFSAACEASNFCCLIGTAEVVPFQDLALSQLSCRL
jgi:hypothetical protein